MKILKKFENGWRIKIGGVNAEKFQIYLRYFSGLYGERKGFRLMINLNTDKLIKLFGFNQKIIGI